MTGGGLAGTADGVRQREVTFCTRGVHTLVASKDYDDIPSAAS